MSVPYIFFSSCVVRVGVGTREVNLLKQYSRLAAKIHRLWSADVSLGCRFLSSLFYDVPVSLH